jgi:hypothetical protein
MMFTEVMKNMTKLTIILTISVINTKMSSYKIKIKLKREKEKPPLLLKKRNIPMVPTTILERLNFS